jgi:hypothetical protein
MFEFDAGSLFEQLRELADKPLPKDVSQDPLMNSPALFLALIEFRSDEDAHNDALQAAARDFAKCVIDLVEAKAMPAWGKPDYRLTFEDELFPAWADYLTQFPNYVIGWRRGRTKVAYVFTTQEDREIPVEVVAGVVPWKAGQLSNESGYGQGLQPLEGGTGKGAAKSNKKSGSRPGRTKRG